MRIDEISEFDIACATEHLKQNGELFTLEKCNKMFDDVMKKHNSIPMAKTYNPDQVRDLIDWYSTLMSTPCDNPNVQLLRNRLVSRILTIVSDKLAPELENTDWNVGCYHPCTCKRRGAQK